MNKSKTLMHNDDDKIFPTPIIFPDNKQVKYYKQSFQVNLYNFYLIDDIREPNEYVDMFNILKTAEPHDVITLNLNSDGGSLRTTTQLMSAMKNTPAMVVTSLEGSIASAATLIFLCGKKFIVNPYSEFMIHSYSTVVAGKGNEVTAKMEFTEKYFRNLCNKIYEGFLTKKEIDQVIDGKDFWFDSMEVVNRLQIKFKKHPNVEIIVPSLG